MKGALVTLLFVASCDLVYGLGDRPPPPPDAPPPGPDIATATFVRAVLTAPGAPVVDLPAPDVSASVVLENGARPEVERVGNDFRFAWTRGMTYHLTFERPDLPPLEYISNAEHLIHAQRELAHDGTVPAGGTFLDVMISNVGLANLTFVMSTGIWTLTSSAGQMLGRIILDWTAPPMYLTGRPRLLAPNDLLYCTEFDMVSDPDSGLIYNALTRSGSTTVAMQNGETTQVNCALQILDHEANCARVVTNTNAELARMNVAIPEAFGGTVSYGTVVLALPSPELGPWSALWLAFINYNATTGTPLLPFTGNVHYANPFPDHTVAVHSSMTRQRTLKAAGATKAATLSAGTFQYYAPEADCGSTTAALGDIAIPSPPAFGGAVVNDGELSLSKTRPVEVSWDDRTPGTVDYYLIQLFRLVAVGEDSRFEEIRSWITTGHELSMDRALLDSEHDYVMQVVAIHGWPNAATGDFRTSRWPAPVASAINISGVFTVAP